MTIGSLARSQTDNSQSDAAEAPRKKAKSRRASGREGTRTKPNVRASPRSRQSRPARPMLARSAGGGTCRRHRCPREACGSRRSAADITRNESPAAAAANAWLRANADGAETRAQSESGEGAAEVAAGASLADGVRIVDPNEVNELDLASSPAPVEGAWIGYLVMMVGGALAAASTARFFLA